MLPLGLLLVLSWPASAGVDMIAWARAAHERLAVQGHVQAEADVAAAHDAESPGSALFDYRTGRCQVTIDEGQAGKHYSTPVGLKFMVYHELAHCHLFANPHEIEAFPELSRTSNRMISDVIHLDYVGWVAGRLNGYLVYHETYADVKAVALLLREGETEKSLQWLRELRGRGGLFYDPHQSAGVYDEAFSVAWTRMTPAEVDAQARLITDRHIVKNFFRAAFPLASFEHMGMSDLLHSSARSPQADLLYDRGEVKAGVTAKLALLQGAPQPAWSVLLRQMTPGRDPEEVSRAFMLERYGKTRAELKDADAEIGAALRGAGS